MSMGEHERTSPLVLPGYWAISRLLKRTRRFAADVGIGPSNTETTSSSKTIARSNAGQRQARLLEISRGRRTIQGYKAMHMIRKGGAVGAGHRASPAWETPTPALGLVQQNTTDLFRYHRRHTTTVVYRLAFCMVTQRAGPNKNPTPALPTLDR
jgi:hypothetical protein